MQSKTINIRTDLDAFSHDEVQALVRHGYSSAYDSFSKSGFQPPQARSTWSYIAENSKPNFIARRERRRARIFSLRDPNSWVAATVLLFWALLISYGGYRLRLAKHPIVPAKAAKANFADVAKKPIKIAVMTLLSGEHKEVGMSQLRGVISGLIQGLNEEKSESDLALNTWDHYFNVTAIDTNGQDITKLFQTTENGYDVIFGPASSGEAKTLFDRRKNLKLRKDSLTILTSAATITPRSHQQYSKELLQLSDNFEQYAMQFARYVEIYKQPQPTRTLIVYNCETEYGRNSFVQLDHFLRENRQVGQLPVSIPYVASKHLQQAQQACSEESPIDPGLGEIPLEIIRPQIEGLFDQIAKSPREETMIIVQDDGPVLVDLIKLIRTRLKIGPTSNISLATLFTMNSTTVRSGNVNSTYLLYSYASMVYSNMKGGFTRDIREADHYIEIHQQELVPNLKWFERPITSDDAESHDAAVYYLGEKLLPKYEGFPLTPNHSLYATDFEITGTGIGFGNVGDLMIFHVEDGKLIFVPAPVYPDPAATTPGSR